MISGRDVVDSIAYRLQGLGRTLTNYKHFQTGVYSDLRNLVEQVECHTEQAKASKALINQIETLFRLTTDLAD